MFNLRKLFLTLLNLFILGATLCSCFMLTIYDYHNIGGRWVTETYSNEYGIVLVSMLPVGLTIALVSLVFSFFVTKRKLYLPSVITNIFVAPFAIIGIVFSAISIDQNADEAASIVATVFCGVSLALTLLTLFLGFSCLKKLRNIKNAKQSNQSYIQKDTIQYNQQQSHNVFLENSNLSKDKDLSVDKMYSDLKKIKELLDDGIITQEEFDEMKKKIIK